MTADTTPKRSRTQGKRSGPKRGHAILCLAGAIVAGVPLMAGSALKHSELQNTAWEKPSTQTTTVQGAPTSEAAEPTEAPSQTVPEVPATTEPAYVEEAPAVATDPAVSPTPSS